MSRVPTLAPDQMNDDQRRIHGEIVSGPHGRVVGPFPAWLHSPKLAERPRALSAFVRFESSLSDKWREIAILTCGRFWKAEFEFHAHANLARQAGVDDAVIQAIARGETPTFSDPKEAILHKFCAELFETRRASDATYQQAVEALGFTTVVEVCATIGYYSMVSITLNAMAVPLPEGAASPFPD